MSYVFFLLVCMLF